MFMAVVSKLSRLTLLVAVIAGSASLAQAQQGPDAAQNRAKLEEGKRAIASMRESYAYVMRKEEAAKSDHDPVMLNSLHQISNRIADLVNVADHALDDMRVAVSSNEPAEAVDGELEKIMLAKTKVEQARAEADRSVGIKLLEADNGEGKTRRDFMNEGANLDEGNDPINALSNSTLLPSSPSRPPPASRATP